MSKKQGTIPKKHSQIIMRQHNFNGWMAYYKKMYGENLFDWPPNAREWYRSVTITDKEVSYEEKE